MRHCPQPRHDYPYLAAVCPHPPASVAVGASDRPGVLGVLLDVLDRVTHRRDLLRVLVRDLDVELLLERHHELHRVQGVGAEILDELRGRNDVVLLDTELLDDDRLDTLLDRLVARSHLRPSPPHMFSPPLPCITWPVI